jgi:uncharacterized protein YjaG (DUF416 family)
MPNNSHSAIDLDDLTVQQLERYCRKKREGIEETETQMIKRIKKADTIQMKLDVQKEIAQAFEEEEVRDIEWEMDELRKRCESAKAKFFGESTRPEIP